MMINMRRVVQMIRRHVTVRVDASQIGLGDGDRILYEQQRAVGRAGREEAVVFDVAHFRVLFAHFSFDHLIEIVPDVFPIHHRQTRAKLAE